MWPKESVLRNSMIDPPSGDGGWWNKEVGVSVKAVMGQPQTKKDHLDWASIKCQWHGMVWKINYGLSVSTNTSPDWTQPVKWNDLSCDTYTVSCHSMFYMSRFLLFTSWNIINIWRHVLCLYALFFLSLKTYPFLNFLFDSAGKKSTPTTILSSPLNPSAGEDLKAVMSTISLLSFSWQLRLHRGQGPIIFSAPEFDQDGDTLRDTVNVIYSFYHGLLWQPNFQ